MILHHHAPSDLRTVDPRQVKIWDSDKAARVTTVRLEIRFGPDSDIAQMLGLAEPTTPRTAVVAHTFTCTVCGRVRRGVNPAAVCRFCRAIDTRGRNNHAEG